MNKFSELDNKFMKLAINEARLALESGNYPVGAVLVVDGEVIGKEQNRKETRKDRISHAETLLFIQHSKKLKTAKNNGAKIELYTTFEPCLMCLGTAVIHRSDRIVVACRDPRGDMRAINYEAIGEWYEKNKPSMEYGLLFDEAKSLFQQYLQQNPDKEIAEARELFNTLKSSTHK